MWDHPTHREESYLEGAEKAHYSGRVTFARSSVPSVCKFLMNIVIKGKLLLSNRHPSASVTLSKVMTFLSLHIFHDNWLLQDQISAHLVTTFWKFQHKVILGFGWLSIKVPLPMQCWSISLYTIHRCWPQRALPTKPPRS